MGVSIKGPHKREDGVCPITLPREGMAKAASLKGVLVDEPWLQRVKGLVANASRCSHAELDEAESLDDSDPVELGAQLADLRRKFPHISILGGCCGTDMRHMKNIAEQSQAAVS
jgi:S-methylmethionine-dependent homocysteine/selenocysteine methylase